MVEVVAPFDSLDWAREVQAEVAGRVSLLIRVRDLVLQGVEAELRLPLLARIHARTRILVRGLVADEEEVQREELMVEVGSICQGPLMVVVG